MAELFIIAVAASPLGAYVTSGPTQGCEKELSRAQCFAFRASTPAFNDDLGHSIGDTSGAP